MLKKYADLGKIDYNYENISYMYAVYLNKYNYMYYRDLVKKKFENT